MADKQEDFLKANSFAVLTDGSKPAMKWAVNELDKRGKKVSVIEVSSGSTDISEIPDDVENIIVGVTAVDPADLIMSLREKGFEHFWVHWNTDTPGVREICAEGGINCITGKCPMMYLGNDFSIHGIHRALAKLTGNY
ncbi:hypothetical protein J2755_001353 [Methanohalophilus levihalophilus]|uniref:hypothetical protein n=1 Tax=Methanohalophilus levihalophilus TaxID=1431282 RepID=UPI001FD8C2BF|nr:hypothetical protein [Methanohalophilus levihalophilus]MBP2030419.1 hypothetical protein [Methanohalophilus levihalophilus]